MEENKPSQKVKKKHPEVRRNNRCLLESIKSEKATQLKAGEGTSRRRRVRRTQPHKASTSECPGGGETERPSRPLKASLTWAERKTARVKGGEEIRSDSQAEFFPLKMRKI